VRYPGSELPLFAHAKNFHRYYLDLFGEHVRGRVLEVGGGMGTLTGLLLDRGISGLTVCEPDPALAHELATRFASDVRVIRGTLEDVPASLGLFDTVVYVDVLEHVEDDAGEIRLAAGRLAPGGSLVIGGPAHQWLYSPFDTVIGHHRRYDRRMVARLVAGCPDLRLHHFAYFDCLGVAVSLLNRWVVRRTTPTTRDIIVWDTRILPISRQLDPLLGHRVGKSFVAIACL